MKDLLFLDTNVLIDLLGERIPFYESIAKITTLADKRKVMLVTSSLSYATTHYILSKYENSEKVKEKLRKFKVISTISPIDESIVEKGLNSKFKDFEDALQYHSALSVGSKIILTRNIKDYKFSEIPVMTAEEYLQTSLQVTHPT